MIKRSQIRSAFQKNQFLDKLKNKYLERNRRQNYQSSGVEANAHVPGSPSSKEFSMVNGVQVI